MTPNAESDISTHATTQKDLARALALSPGYLSKLRRRPWFPAAGPEGWDVEACRRAIQANVGRREDERAAPSSVPAPAPAAALAPRGAARGTDAQLVETLRSHASDPVEVARAAMRVSAGALADAVDGGTPHRAVVDLKKALEELRRCEQGYLELARDRGEVIDRAIARTVAGELAQRLVEILNNVEALLAARIEEWVGDRAFLELETEERKRQVRSWFDAQARALRAGTADEIEAMIEQERSST